MVGIVSKATGELLQYADAWETGSVERMKSWAHDNDYSVIDTEITFSGNMLIWVE